MTSPDQPVGETTGLGDINLFDVLLFKAERLELGFGPQLTVPSATDDLLGRARGRQGWPAL